MKKHLPYFLLIVILFSACNWFKYSPEVGKVLSEHFKNKIFKEFDTAKYNLVFEKTLNKVLAGDKNKAYIQKWYQQNEQLPVLITKFYTDGSLDSLSAYLKNSTVHGISSQTFGAENYQAVLKRLSAKKFKNIDEVYPVIAALEVTAAKELVAYSNALNFGLINPKNYLNRYYIQVKRPDSLEVSKVLNKSNLIEYLHEIQPKSAAYKGLQDQLKLADDDLLKEKISINLERLRWKLPEVGSEYVVVNIPDFHLTWFKDQDTLIYMKVCVGARREKDYEEKIKVWLKTKNLDDKPKNHETPVLFSAFNSIQVNPVWNIPVSIAQSEIYYQALKDSFYLSNNNINVYYKDKLVADPDTIQWNKYARDKLPFKFKQGSGDGNALGKFKFIFDNSASIYLHDTNNKGGFNLKNRAISHGCVRVEKPLEFAEFLLKDAGEYDKLRMEVNLPPTDTTKMKRYEKMRALRNDTTKQFKLNPAWFGIKKQIPIVINYFTAWVNNQQLVLRDDIYGQDEILGQALKKYLAFR